MRLKVNELGFKTKNLKSFHASYRFLLSLDLFSQHYKNIFENYHFICFILYHCLAVFKSPENILGSSEKHRSVDFSH